MDQNKRFIIIVVLLVVLVAVFFGGFRRGLQGVNKDTYQAVYLGNQQLYFGKLAAVRGGYLHLTDIYYLKDNAGNKNATSTLSLIKYGDEVHQPQDEMFINRDQILFWQNLKAEGKVVQLIYQQKLQTQASPAAN